MTQPETLEILSVLKAAYPNYFRTMKRRDAESMVSLWASMFADIPAPIIAAAVKAHIATNTFFPSISEINEAAYRLAHQDALTEQEAWNIVARAVENSGYHSVEEFSKLPETIQRIVGSPNRLREWALMDIETINSVVASNFQRSYRARSASEREYLSLPEDVRQTISQLTNGFAMPGLEAGE